jgi:MFS family permease
MDEPALTATASEETPVATPSGFLARRTHGLPAPFWWLWFGSLINRAGTFVGPFFILYLTGPRDVPVRTAGLVLTVWGAGQLLSQPIGGYLSDRIGRRATLGTSLGLTAASLTALGLAHNLALISALALLLGTVGDMYRPAATAAIADVVDDEHRERAYALLFWAVNLGFSIASVGAGLLLHLGFGLLFVLDAATTLAFGLLALRFVPETRPDSPAGEHAARLTDPVRLLHADRLLLLAAAITLAYGVLYGQVQVLLPLSMKDAGLSASVYGYVVAINGVLIVLLQPLAIGWLARLPRRATQPAGLALVGAGLAVTPVCHAPITFGLSVVAWTLGEIAVSGAFQATIAALAPSHKRGRYAGALGLARGAAGLLAPLLGTSSYALSPWLTSGGCLVAGFAAAGGQRWLLGAIGRRRSASAKPTLSPSPAAVSSSALRSRGTPHRTRA